MPAHEKNEAAATRSVRLRDGTQLRATVSGAGSPIVCCHGGPGLWDYLAPLADLIDDRYTVVRFDQRGCGRSTGTGPFTIKQALDDLDQLRTALGIDRWAVAGHSWGAELALRYATQHPEHTNAVIYICGVGAGDDFRPAYEAERDRRLGKDLGRWRELGARDRTPPEEHEWCLLQWRPDFAPATAAQHAAALWESRPPGTSVNTTANRELWADRDTQNLLQLARQTHQPVTMIFGAEDPRPWRATDPLFEALPNATRVVIQKAGHAPWTEQGEAVRDSIVRAMLPRTEGSL